MRPGPEWNRPPLAVTSSRGSNQIEGLCGVRNSGLPSGGGFEEA